MQGKNLQLKSCGIIAKLNQSYLPICDKLMIAKNTIDSTLEQVEELLKSDKKLSASAKSLFRVLVLIIRALVRHKPTKPKKKIPKKRKEPKGEGPEKHLTLEEENAKLKAELEGIRIKNVNKEANKPSSKQPEWEPKGVGNEPKSGKLRREKKKREGSGNKRKTRDASVMVKATLECCTGCGEDLSSIKPLKDSNTRIIEDIPEVLEPKVIAIEQEKKYCQNCHQVVTAKSDLALPGADIGLNSTTLICYLWVSMGLPFTRIAKYMQDFFGFGISTSGLSKHVIRVSGILEEVYDEILEDVRVGCILYADETGWRIKGRNWWLWVFGTDKSAYFVIDKSRGGDVVRRILGEVFLGVMVVDGWGAYLSIISEQQSCMAHLLRKIRNSISHFPS